MRRFIRSSIACSLLISAMLTSARAQNPEITKAQQLLSAARKSYQARDFSTSLRFFKEALMLRPDHPTIAYNIAALSVRVGDIKEALTELSVLSSMGMVYTPEKDSDFVEIWGIPDFKRIVSSFSENAKPVGRSFDAIRVTEKGLIAEGIAFDTRTKSFYISSVRKRKVIQIDKGGKEREFSGAADGLWSAMGMQVDSKRGVLWVCSSALPQMSGYRKEDEGRAGVFKYELSTGKLLGRYVMGDSLDQHTLGDMTLTSAGEPYVSDSRSQAIYRIPAGSNGLQLFVQSKEFVNLQGLVLSEDDRDLYVADYSRGLFRVDVSTAKVTLLPPAKNATLLGIDGLSRSGRDLIAIQNGVNPHRVVRFHLNQRGDAIESWQTLEANNAAFDEPTLGVIDGDSFYFIANSQWSKVDRNGILSPEANLANHLVLKIELGGL